MKTNLNLPTLNSSGSKIPQGLGQKERVSETQEGKRDTGKHWFLGHPPEAARLASGSPARCPHAYTSSGWLGRPFPRATAPPHGTMGVSAPTQGCPLPPKATAGHGWGISAGGSSAAKQRPQSSRGQRGNNSRGSPHSAKEGAGKNKVWEAALCTAWYLSLNRITITKAEHDFISIPIAWRKTYLS